MATHSKGPEKGKGDQTGDLSHTQGGQGGRDGGNAGGKGQAGGGGKGPSGHGGNAAKAGGQMNRPGEGKNDDAEESEDQIGENS